ncbi:hypothetical protein RYX36_036181 [Vicia faba]
MYFHYRIHGVLLLVLFFLSIFSSSSSSTSQINSNSVLVALLDSHYTELVELIEKAMLLQTLENTVATHNITIFAPNNEALERNLDSDFKQFLLEPGNIHSLQTLLLSHVIPTGIVTGSTRNQHHHQHKTLSNHNLHQRPTAPSHSSGLNNVSAATHTTTISGHQRKRQPPSQLTATPWKAPQ